MPTRREPPPATLRPALEGDLPRIVELMWHGAVTASPERPTSPLPEGYLRAFDAIKALPGFEIYVAELEGEVVGTCQLAILPNLSNGGQPVAQLEAVHVAPEWRGRGVGEQMVAFAIAEARERGCLRVQLTSNKARHRAHRFYERLGFVASHEGMRFLL